nr:MAG TPA: hypothetical protein [Caudoviricetes sp.]
MLNDIRYKILAYLQSVTSASPKELFDLFEPAQYRTVKAELACLSEIALIRFTGSSYLITAQGLSAFLSENESRNQKADEDAKQRAEDSQRVKDKQQSYKHDFAVAAFSVAFALILEHIVDIVNFIKSLF